MQTPTTNILSELLSRNSVKVSLQAAKLDEVCLTFVGTYAVYGWSSYKSYMGAGVITSNASASNPSFEPFGMLGLSSDGRLIAGNLLYKTSDEANNLSIDVVQGLFTPDLVWGLIY